jgi:hypothetical protein
MSDINELHDAARSMYDAYGLMPAQQKLSDLVSDVKIDSIPGRVIATARY